MSLYDGFERSIAENRSYIPLQQWHMHSDITLIESIEIELNAGRMHSSIVYISTCVEGLKCIIDHNGEEIPIIITEDKNLCLYFNISYPVNLKYLNSNGIYNMIRDASSYVQITYDEDKQNLNYTSVTYDLSELDLYSDYVDINHLLHNVSKAIDDSLDYLDELREKYAVNI